MKVSGSSNSTAVATAVRYGVDCAPRNCSVNAPQPQVTVLGLVKRSPQEFWKSNEGGWLKRVFRCWGEWFFWCADETRKRNRLDMVCVWDSVLSKRKILRTRDNEIFSDSDEFKLDGQEWVSWWNFNDFYCTRDWTAKTILLAPMVRPVRKRRLTFCRACHPPPSLMGIILSTVRSFENLCNFNSAAKNEELPSSSTFHIRKPTPLNICSFRNKMRRRQGKSPAIHPSIYPCLVEYYFWLMNLRWTAKTENSNGHHSSSYNPHVVLFIHLVLFF